MLIKSVIVIALVLTVVGSGDTACKSSPPTLPPGGKWIPNEGCTSGGVYFTAGKGRQRCHCWGHCGYICESAGGSRPGGGSGNGGGSQGGSPCAFGGVYFNGKGQRCHCQSFNKQPYYVCETPTTTTSTTAPGSGGNSPEPGAPGGNSPAPGGVTPAPPTGSGGNSPAPTTPAPTTPAPTTPAPTTPAPTTPAPTTPPPTTSATG